MSYTIASRLVIEAEDEDAAYALLRRLERAGARWAHDERAPARAFDMFTEEAGDTDR